MALFRNDSQGRLRGEQMLEPSTSHLARGSKISGKLCFTRPVFIEGQVDGEIDGTEVTIAASGVVSARVRAESVLVWGALSGDITASRRIEIHSVGKIIGNITAPNLIVDEGAMFEGDCAMSSQSEHATTAVISLPDPVLVPTERQA